MDIALASVALSQLKVQQQTGIAVMRKVIDTTQQNSAVIVKLMNSCGSGNAEIALLPHLGANLDITA